MESLVEKVFIHCAERIKTPEKAGEDEEQKIADETGKEKDKKEGEDKREEG